MVQVAGAQRLSNHLMSTPRLLVLLCACILSFALVPPRALRIRAPAALPPHYARPPAAELTEAEPFVDFFSALESSISRDNFISFSLAKPTLPPAPSALDPPLMQSVTGRLVMLKAGLHLQLSLRYPTNEQCKNWPVGAAAATAAASREVQRLAASHAFRKAQLCTATRRLELSMNHATGQARAVEEEVASPLPVPSAQDLKHDRVKTRPVDTASPFLHALGVTTVSGRPLTGMRDKLRQIERFVEILAGLVDKSPSLSAAGRLTHGEGAAPLRIVDMGSGLAYLTFAVHTYFRQRYPQVQTCGVEARPALVSQCQETARRLGPDYEGLRFVAGDIGEFASAGAEGGVEREAEAEEAEAVGRAVARGGCGGAGTTASAAAAAPSHAPSAPLGADGSVGKDSMDMDVLIALHACDVATDLAIFSGIARGAAVIVTSPCCHKEARRQMDAGLPASVGKRAAPDGSAAAAQANTAVEGGSSGVHTLLGVGIFRERTAEMVTDAIRAQCLEWAGYDCTVLEFVGGEHTAKNVMLAAVRRERGEGREGQGLGQGQGQAEAASRIAGLMRTYGLRQQKLVGLLGIDVGLGVGVNIDVGLSVGEGAQGAVSAGVAKGRGRRKMPKL